MRPGPAPDAAASGPPLPAALAALAALAAGCATPGEHRSNADEEVYALINERRELLFEEADRFDVERGEDILRHRLLKEAPGEALQLDVVAALEIAAENNRDYQSQRESLYREALDLTLERWRLSWQHSAGGDAVLSGSGGEDASAAVSGDLGMSRLFGSGAQVLGGIGTSLLRVVSTGDGWDAVADASLSITQPLLRGSARAVVLEPLTQAERDLVYEVRSYERFRRTFAVDLVRRYYGILQTLDNIENEEANLESVRLVRRRNEALYDAGQLTDIELDQARQDELRSENNLLRLRESYGRQLDQFKLQLGLPTEIPIELDPAELANVMEVDGTDMEGLDADLLARLALQRRLDYLNTVDARIDAERRVRVAADALRAGLDLEASVSGASEEGRPLAFRSQDLPWSFGFSLDLPVDQLPERNAYRRSLLDREAARRGEEELRDRILADLRDDLRQARSLRQRYEIQQSAVELNRKRVRSARLRQNFGRADTRDVLEAQEDLLSAQNAATSALIDFALARLRLYQNVELLDVDEGGIILESDALPRPPEEQP